MEQEKLLEEIIKFFPELMSLWSQKSEKERHDLIKKRYEEFRKKFDEICKK
tara:strand:+ start:105 stop:257 length:153 start_codon:yes stop_codon:yes gene_type:complete